ncbi:MAG: hypothetical protein NTX82_02340 [Candidatus Parcubacteria bacterium]|nr:hypothetical protein [Candidatus Parcubacteria bacterium]
MKIFLNKELKIRLLDERKYLKASDPKQQTYIILYADKCAFISRDAKNNPVGVIIENQMIYVTQKIIFIKLWEMLK